MHLLKYALSGSSSRMEARLQATLADPTLLDQSCEVQAVTAVRSRQRSTDVALVTQSQHRTSAGSIERAAAALDPLASRQQHTRSDPPTAHAASPRTPAHFARGKRATYHV
jgi:hypothetical protein